MTVYVDAAIHSWRGRMWCHLFSADLDALHAFARRLGMEPRWFQQPPGASWPHYDLVPQRRAAALRLGAVEADRRTTVLVANDALLAWCRIHRADMVAACEAKRERLLSRADAPPVPLPAPAQGSLFD